MKYQESSNYLINYKSPENREKHILVRNNTRMEYNSTAKK